MDAADLTALQLAQAYAARRLTPVDALEACLTRIERLNPLLNAVVTLDVTGARCAASESARRWQQGRTLSPLDGVPLTIKDNLLVSGLRATWGSKLYETFMPDCDELPIARLRAAGLVIVGKTNVPEFTLQGYTDNLLFGTTRNPWNPKLTPGGSSGGAVAAVASGMTPIAVCTDGGGSIRRPASHCGLIGHKPTIGRVARGNGFPAVLHDFEVVGPIARTLPDIDAVMQILAGADRADPRSLYWPSWRCLDDRSPKPLRIAYLPTFAGAPVDPEIAKSVEDAAKVFSAIGHDVRVVVCPFDPETVGNIFAVVSQAGLSWLLRGREDKLHRCGATFREMAERGARLSAADYIAMLAQAEIVKRQLAGLFANYDVILTPAAASLPWPAEETHPGMIAGQPVGPRGHAIFTAFANVTGLPGLAIPCDPSRAGLPIGYQMVAEQGGDELLFAVASEYLTRCPWHMNPRPMTASAH
jgi:aspartyl-tRNA(Asn)/glutamyl-tRNA(Gln) amidotransferase subunit A